jgi:WD40 repeat protein
MRKLLLLLLIVGPLTAATSAEKKPTAPQVPKDMYGDPLPKHAALRLGSTRLRHHGPIRSLAIAPSGFVAATAGADGVRVWSVPGGQQFFVLKQPTPVTALAYSPNGETMAIGHADGRIHLWNSLKRLDGPQLTGPSSSVEQMAFSADGALLAVASRDGQLVLWDIKTQKELAKVAAHPNGAFAVAFAPSGKMIASAGADNTVKLWDGTLNTLRVLTGHTEPVRAVAFSPDGKRLASGSEDSTWRLWEPETGKQLREVVWMMNPVHQLIWTYDGKSIWTGSGKRFLARFDAETGKRTARFEGHDGAITGLALTRKTDIVVSASEDGTLRFWDPEHHQEIVVVNRHGAGMRAVAFSEDDKRVICGNADCAVSVWGAEGGEFLRKLGLPRIPDHIVMGGVHSKNSPQFVTALTGDTQFVWHSGTSQEAIISPPARIKSFGDRVRSVALAEDGHWLAFGTMYKRIRIFDMEAAGRYSGRGPEVWMGQAKVQIMGHDGVVSAVAFSPDGATLASGGEDGKIKLWATKGGEEQRALDGHPGGVGALAFARDGKTLYSVGADGLLVAWDPATGKKVRDVKSQHGPTHALTLSPDGSLLATGGDVGLVRFWRGDFTEAGKLDGHDGPVRALAFSKDGARFASGSDDSTALVYDLPADLRAKK